MLTLEQFQTRTKALYGSCRDRWRVKLRKSMPKGVALDILPGDVLPFTQQEFSKWMWAQIGLNAIPCPYCRAPIDILNLSLDHRTPLRRGGGPELSNLQPICKRCNSAKGEFTHEEYLLIVAFMEGAGSHIRQRLEGCLINAGVGNMMRKFPRDKKGGPSKKGFVATQNRLDLELGDF